MGFGTPVGGGDGILSFRVWPTHVGAVDANGEEPIGHPDYARGQITWAPGEDGVLRGSARITVPRIDRDWTHVVYSHSPTGPVIVTAQRLPHPLGGTNLGHIDMDGITEADITPPITAAP